MKTLLAGYDLNVKRYEAALYSKNEQSLGFICSNKIREKRKTEKTSLRQNGYRQ